MITVSCLTATYGRWHDLTRAISCFVNQTYPYKELIVLNNHPIPIKCNIPNVIVINEPGYKTLGDCRNRLLQLANGEFIRTWDDDDLYLPWTLQQGIDNIGSFAAWKPARSWVYTPQKFQLEHNYFEASILMRKEFVVKHGGYTPNSSGDEHLQLYKTLEQEKALKTTEMGLWSSYVYCWGWGNRHISGSLDQNKPADIRAVEWMKYNQDVSDKPIEIIDLCPIWKQLESRIVGFSKEQTLKFLHHACNSSNPG